MTCGVYVVRLKRTNKVYVGSSVNVEVRFKQHRKSLNLHQHTSAYLQNSWNSHSSSSFVFELIEECPKEERFVREQFYIDTLNSCFNMSKLAAGGSRKEDWTEERCAALAESCRREYAALSPAERKFRARKPQGFGAKMSAILLENPSSGMLGKHHREESKQKSRESNIRALPTRKFVGMTGKKHKPETLAKMAAAKLGKKQSPEHVAARFAWRDKAKN